MNRPGPGEDAWTAALNASTGTEITAYALCAEKGE
jgi:hypothetical protein